jgi:hypothetical protein
LFNIAKTLMTATRQSERIGETRDTIRQDVIERMPLRIKFAEGIFRPAQFNERLLVTAFLIQGKSGVKEPLSRPSFTFRGGRHTQSQPPITFFFTTGEEKFRTGAKMKDLAAPVPALSAGSDHIRLSEYFLF